MSETKCFSPHEKNSGQESEHEYLTALRIEIYMIYFQNETQVPEL